MIKILLDFFFRKIRFKKSFYGFFYYLFLEGLKGIEHGVNYGDTETSGEKHVLAVVKKISANPVIIDGGANVGQFAKMASRVFENQCSIHCFEPSVHTFKILETNLKAPGPYILNNLALSDETRRLVLKYDKKGSHLASLVDLDYSHYGLAMNQREEIQATTLDEYCLKNKIQIINLLKLDVEGYEMIALKGASSLIQNKAIDVIQWEMGRPNVDSKSFFKDFYQLLAPHYAIYRIVSWGLTRMKVYSYEYELFLGSNYMAIRNNILQDVGI